MRLLVFIDMVGLIASGSICAPGARWAFFFSPFPTRACFCSPHQTIWSTFSPPGGGDSAGPRTPTTPPPPPLGASGRQLVVKGMSPRSQRAPKAPRRRRRPPGLCSHLAHLWAFF